MKQKNNIFEELNKMKNLINTKRGVVISEQTMVGMIPTASAAPAAPAAPKSEEQKIADGIVSATQGGGTNKKNFLGSINKIKDSKQFWNINAYLKTVGNKLDFAGIVNDEMDNDDGVDVQTIVNKLKSIGVGSTADINEYNNFKPGTFKFGPEGQANPAAAAPEELTKREELWKTTYSCVTTQPGAKAIKLKDGTTSYLVGQIYYYNTGRKKLADGTMKNYSCSTEFKSGNNKSNDYARIVNDYSKQIQSSLGSSPTGKMSSQDLDLILKRLNGEDVSVEVPQELPKDVTGKPDLDKILASLQN